MSDETLEISIDNHTAGLDENEKVVSIGHAYRVDKIQYQMVNEHLL